MPLYRYTAKKGPDEVVEDTIEARNREEAVNKINQMGYLATRLTVVNANSAEKPRSASRVPVQAVRVKSRELTVLTRQLASLLKSGVPILQALTILSDQAQSNTAKQVFNEIGVEVKQGRALSASMERYPQVFSSLYVSMVRAGEDSGNLQDMLLNISAHRQSQEEAVGKVRAALAYPILMLVTGIATIAFMLIFVLPRMKQIFFTLGQELPLPTQIVLASSELLRQWGWAILLIFLALAWILKRSARTQAHRKAQSALVLKLPLVGELVRRMNLARFCRTLELLIRSGIPVLSAIQLGIPVAQNEVLKDELLKCHQKLEHGASFGKSLKQSGAFPSFMTNLVAVGEESGRLDDTLGEIAGAYEKDVDESMKIITALFEPMMILSMGLVVGFIVVAMLLPVFEMNFMGPS